MTIGQRIAQKRKELTLSQEALGEQLGVSRQAIYKWESDTALPEIDKLITLAKRFGVSVGWLLGVEEAPVPEVEEAETPPPQNDLSEQQLAMVKEIVEQYLAAQPQPRPRKKWPFVLLALALVVAGSRLSSRLDQLNRQYNQLQNSVSNVTNTVDRQIDGISDRIETILKSQNELTAEYGTEISGANLTKNQIRFHVYAVPKTYVEGMTVTFSADNRTGGVIKTFGEEGMNRKFTATLATELTDNITLSVTFVSPDGTQETQVLDTYEGLLWASMPRADVHDHDMIFSEVPDGTLHIPVHYATVIPQRPDKALDGTETAITDIRVGLFKNKALLLWAEPMNGAPENGYAYGTELLFKFPEIDLQLRELDKLHVAALITDQYGRQTVAHDIPCVIDPESGQLTWADGTYVFSDPADWDFS